MDRVLWNQVTDELRSGERLIWWGFCLDSRGRRRRKGPGSRKVYALTDRRVFVLRGKPWDRRVKSLPLRFIKRVSLTTRPTESTRAFQRFIRRGTVTEATPELGTIAFQPVSSSSAPNSRPFLQFSTIGNAERVLDLVLEAQAKAAGQTA
jgi:hypothetical protein